MYNSRENSMKINRILWLFALWLAALPVSAQQPDARGVLDRAADVFRKAGGVEVAFAIHAPEGDSAGTIRLKGNKLMLELPGAVTWFDGHTQWSYLAASNEVNVSEPSAEELQSINPYSWLSLYKQGYNLKMERPDTGNAYKIVMTADKRTQEIQSLTLYMDRSSYHPLKLDVLARGSKVPVTLSVRSCRTGQSFPDSMFAFDRKRYPGVEVIDLR